MIIKRYDKFVRRRLFMMDNDALQNLTPANVISFVNAVLDEIKADPTARAELANEAINWADLQCVGAGTVVDAQGNSHFCVWIEEAAPEAYKLQQMVQKQFELQGFIVAVNTQW